MVLVSVIISILIMLAIVLYKEMELRNQIRQLINSGFETEKEKGYTRTAKDVKRDMMRIYRDMGALKIIMQDGIIEKSAYNKEIKSLEERINVLKKEHDKLAKVK